VRMEETTDEKTVAAPSLGSLEELAAAQRPWTDAEGRAVVEAWRSSGLRRLEFCEKYGFKFHKLAWWASNKGRQRLSPASQTPAFREVKLVSRGDVGLGAQARGSTACAGSMEVALANGCRVHVGADFDALALERLLGVLGRAC
jgi:hypothetical protein